MGKPRSPDDILRSNIKQYLHKIRYNDSGALKILPETQFTLAEIELALSLAFQKRKLTDLETEMLKPVKTSKIDFSDDARHVVQ